MVFKIKINQRRRNWNKKMQFSAIHPNHFERFKNELLYNRNNISNVISNKKKTYYKSNNMLHGTYLSSRASSSWIAIPIIIIPF